MATFTIKHPQNRELLGGDVLAQSLAQLDVKTIFGLHGGHLDAFLVGCATMGIHLVDTRHETVSVQAAEGYAKLTGKIGTCFITANSGFSNGLPGLATAYADRSPVFCITSSPPLRDAETNALQGAHDQVVVSKALTKFAHRVTNVEEIPRIVSYAARMATTGAMGPVLVDFPIDVLFSPPRSGAISFGSITMPPSLPPAPNPAAITTLVEWWKQAKRPVIITGTGALRTASTTSPKENLLLQLAETTQTPVFFSTKASTSAAVPWDNPLRGGPATALAFLKPTGQPLPDLIVMLGARTGFMLGGRSGAIIPDTNRKLVQIDLDGGEIGKALPIDLGIISDASQFISALLPALGSDKLSRDSSWLKTTSELKNMVHKQYENDQPVNSEDGLLHPYHGLNRVFKALAPLHPIIIVDGGEAGVWAMDLWETAQPAGGMNSTGYLGFLGNGFGYALGAALAHPDKLIINLHGDGSAGFHIAELDTYARHQLKVLTIVQNNYKWGMSIAGQDIIYGTDETARPVSSLSPVCKFEIVAEGFGCHGARIEKVEEIDSVVQRITKAMLSNAEGKSAGLINMIVSTKPVTNATKGMVGRPEGWTGKGDDDVIVVPYYDNVPRAYYAEDLEKQGWSRPQKASKANGTTNGDLAARFMKTHGAF